MVWRCHARLSSRVAVARIRRLRLRRAVRCHLRGWLRVGRVSLQAGRSRWGGILWRGVSLRCILQAGAGLWWVAHWRGVPCALLRHGWRGGPIRGWLGRAHGRRRVLRGGVRARVLKGSGRALSIGVGVGSGIVGWLCPILRARWGVGLRVVLREGLGVLLRVVGGR